MARPISFILSSLKTTNIFCRRVLQKRVITSQKILSISQQRGFVISFRCDPIVRFICISHSVHNMHRTTRPIVIWQSGEASLTKDGTCIAMFGLSDRSRWALFHQTPCFRRATPACAHGWNSLPTKNCLPVVCKKLLQQCSTTPTRRLVACSTFLTNTI